MKEMHMAGAAKCSYFDKKAMLKLLNPTVKFYNNDIN